MRPNAETLHPERTPMPAVAGTDPGHVIRLEGVSKSFGGTKALDDITFEVPRGQVHALLGGNGSGTSTLIKLLAGVHQADEGHIEVAGSRIAASRVDPLWAHEMGLRFVHQGIGTFAELTVAENFALASGYGGRMVAPINWRALRKRVQATMDRFELSVSASALMGDLNAATQTMVAIARALADEDRSAVLVLDEPTSALPPDGVEQLHEAVRRYTTHGHTVIVVTHRLDEVTAIAQTATFLRDGRHLATRPVQDTDERMLIDLIAGMDHAPVQRASARTFPDVRLEVGGLAAGPLEDISLTVGRGEVLGVAGLVGSGRSSLLGSLFGARRLRAGTVTLDGEHVAALRPADAIKHGIAYVPEDRAGEAALPERPVRENLTAPDVHRYWRGLRLRRGEEVEATRAAIDRYGIVTASGEADLSSLSGGNQQKVVIARWLELGPRLLLLDEPTQGVDVGARRAIHELIREAAGRGTSVLVASSDSRELAELCDRVVGLTGGRLVGEISGDAVDTEACTALAYGLTAKQINMEKMT
jgi:ribose transport system ATP-binding protein